MADVNFRLGPISFTPISLRSESDSLIILSMESISRSSNSIEYFSTSASRRKSATDMDAAAWAFFSRSRCSTAAGPASTLGTEDDDEEEAEEVRQTLDKYLAIRS